MSTETLREQNKSDKLRRIREAALDLFATKGFDTTSTREIAARANVALATLFLYAADKRDLLFLACNDDLEELTERAFAHVDEGAAVLDQLVGVFREFYLFYGRNRQLSRDLLRELTFYTEGQQSIRFQATRQRTISRVTALVAVARARGSLRCESSDADVAQVVFYVFAAEVRHWLGSQEASPEAGLARFERLLRVVISGLQAT